MWKRGIKCLKEKDRRFTKGLWWIVGIVASLGILVFIIIVKEKSYTDIKSQYNVVNKQQFIFIQEPEMTEIYGKDYGINFDLKNKNFFSYHYAMKGNNVYGFIMKKKKLSKLFLIQAFNIKFLF